MPIPTTVSEAAQRRLGRAMDAPSYPAADDTDGWLQMVAGANRSTADRFPIDTAAVAVEQFDAGGATVYVARPHGVDDDGPLYLWMHPGAFLVGGGDACRSTTARTAVSLQTLTWGLDYGTPPLRPFPAGLDDAIAAYRAALDGRDPSRIVVGGTSSGGNLAAALLLRAKDEGLPMPAALVLTTPSVDLTEAGDTFRTLADLDVLSSTAQMHRALRAAGVDAELHVFEAMPHGGFGGDTPEDLELVAEQRRFLAKHAA